MQRSYAGTTALLVIGALAGCGGDGKDRETSGTSGPLCDTPLCLPAENGPAASTSVRLVELANSSDLIFDPGTQRIYVAVSGSPGSVVPIDPSSATAGTAIAVGNGPRKLARSDDNAFLYVGFQGQGIIQRIALGSQAVVLTIALGTDPNPTNLGQMYVEDMEVLPGNPQSIAVSLRFQGVSPRHAGVAVFDDDVQRPLMTAPHTGSNLIEFSATAGTLYGLNAETTEFGFRTMAVDATGVTESANNTTLFSTFGVDIRFAGGFIFASNGNMIDPVAGTVVRTFTLPSPFGNLVVPDVSLGRVFYLTNEASRWSIRAFDIATGSALGTEPIEDIPETTIDEDVRGTPVNMVRWGTKGLAFTTDQGQVFLVTSPVLIP